MRIRGDMEIEDIIEMYPDTVGPMQEMGVQCMVCGEPVWGTLREKVEEKGLNLQQVLQRLNRVVEEIENQS